MSKQRLDRILALHFPDWSRSKLQSLIEKNCVQINQQGWKIENRPGAKFDPDLISKDNIRILDDEEFHFVSRGALKLKKAIEDFAIPLQGRLAMDVGLSTGGFSDYLLKKGVAKILGIDVGSEQLHEQLKSHPRLVWYDKVNAKEPIPTAILAAFFNDMRPQFDLIVVDVSFISLSKIIKNLKPLLKDSGDLVTLLKPQFELTKSDLNKKGVVKSIEGLDEAKKKIIEVLQQNKLQIMGIIQSPIEGENGNKEFLIWSRPISSSSGGL